MCKVQTNHEVPVTFLRGLQARSLWATAQLNADEFGFGDAQTEAFMQGMHDYECGRDLNDIPPMLADVRGLVVAWQDGWGCACEVDVDVCGFHS